MHFEELCVGKEVCGQRRGRKTGGSGLCRKVFKKRMARKLLNKPCYFVYICNKLQCRLLRRNTTMRQAIIVQKRVAVTLWKLATNSDYRSIGHPFGTSKAAVCCIVQEVSQCIVDVLMPRYIKIPQYRNLLHFHCENILYAENTQKLFSQI